MRTEDGYIVSKCLNGDKAAFGLLVDKYKASIYALAYSKLHNFHDAEDVVQEAFIKAYQKLHTLRYWDNFLAWLYSITSNLCKDWVRSQSSRPDGDYIEDQPDDFMKKSSMNSYRQDSMVESLDEALNSLPENYRLILTLHYLGGLKRREIARFLGVSTRTVTHRLSMARARLKKEMVTMMSESYQQHKLNANFTFKIVETVRKIRVKPLPRNPWIPWGLSTAVCVLFTLISMNLSSNIPKVAAFNNITSSVPVEKRMVKESTPRGIKEDKIASQRHVKTPVSSKNIPVFLTEMSSGENSSGMGDAQDYLMASGTPEGNMQQKTTVSGKITKAENGRPISGAEVRPGLLRHGSATTDQDGNYEFELKNYGDISVWVAADGFATQFKMVAISRGQKLENIDFALIPGTDVIGRVIDDKGNPIENAEVRTPISGNSGKRIGPARTDLQGQYTLKGLEQSHIYKITAEHQDYKYGQVEIEVTKTGKTNVPDIMLKPRAGINVTGKVTNEAGEPISGAEVIAGKMPYMSENLTAKTDETGRYTVKYLPEGDNCVIAKAEGYASGLKSIDVGKRNMELDIVLNQGKILAGKVTEQDGKPIQGVSIAFGLFKDRMRIHHIVTWTKTDADGKFEAENIPDIEGTHIDAAVMRDGYTDIRGVSVTPGDTNLEFVMKQSGKLAGRVVDAETSKPITHFIIKLDFPKLEPGEDVPRYGMSCDWNRSGVSYVSDEGEFVAPGFPVGSIYKLTAIADGYAPATVARVTATEKTDFDDLVISMEREIIVKGIVTDAETGRPLENATIHHFNAEYPMISSPYSNAGKSGTGSTLSGTDGSFSIGAVPGENFLYVDHIRYAPMVIGPFEGKPSVIAKLNKGGKVSGHARKGTEPISGHSIKLRLLEGIPNIKVKEDHEVMQGKGLFAYMKITTTDDEGYFEIENLIPGKYRLSQMMSGEGFATSVRITEIQVSEGETTSVTLGGGGGVKLHGVVTGEDGKPIKDATVSVRIEDDLLHSGGADITDSDGNYEIRDLPMGIHQLSAMKIERCLPGEACPMPMRYTGTVEVSEGAEEIEQNIKLTSGGFPTPKVPEKYAPPDIDSSGKKIILPEETTEKYPKLTDFEDGFEGWIKWNIEDEISTQTCEIIYDEEKKSNVVEFKRTNGGSSGSQIGLAHDVYIDLSKYNELYLQMDMKPIYQSLEGTGWAGGGEYPVNVELTFVDEKGIGYRWLHGVYYKGESKYPSSSTKVGQKQWHTYISPNLKEMIPVCADAVLVEDGRRYGKGYHEYNPPVVPKAITRILIFGGGWDFIGRADNIQFKTSP
ncbi:sigma-70 family RNA polymerase sigma factor [Candidatus Poribacteria bacterium]|nr:sigma-70 family RNA polymerase sigma factor [Candidatus Poribacteria bacterium]